MRTAAFSSGIKDCAQAQVSGQLWSGHWHWFALLHFTPITEYETSCRMRPDFPTKEQVEKATHEELGRWFRFLPEGDTPEEKKLLDRIADRFEKLGGMIPALSKKIGHGGV